MVLYRIILGDDRHRSCRIVGRFGDPKESFDAAKCQVSTLMSIPIMLQIINMMYGANFTGDLRPELESHSGIA